jgi:hypothetical protein
MCLWKKFLNKIRLQQLISFSVFKNRITWNSLLKMQMKVLASSNASVCAGFEVLTPVVMKSSIFWDITPGSPLKVN